MRRHALGIWSLHACLLLGAPAVVLDGQAVPAVADVQARIEEAQAPASGELGALTLAELMARFGVPGVSIAVVHDFNVHWARAYGMASTATGVPVTTRTMFQAASISKPVHAVVVMRLVEQGRLSLDADVNTWLASWRVPRSAATTDAPVTLRSLLGHASGADDGFGFPGYKPDASRPTLRQILDGAAPSNVGPVRFARPPLAAYKYSGGGTTLTQLLMEDVVGEPAARYMQALVLDPLGMTDSTCEQPLPPALASRAAHAHDRQGRPRDAPWHVYPEQAAAGLWTTAGDLAKVVIEVQQALRGPRGAVLTQASARDMTTPVGVGPFGAGFTIEKRGEGWYFSHGGSNWGFRASIVGHLRKGYGLAVMTNADQGTAVIREIEARVAAAYRWDSLDQPLPR